MIQMKHEEFGLHMMPESAIDEATSLGWYVVTKAPIAKPVETVTIPAQPEVKRSPGRPRNVVPSVLNDGEI